MRVGVGVPDVVCAGVTVTLMIVGVGVGDEVGVGEAILVSGYSDV